jgi:hypothetical protein
MALLEWLIIAAAAFGGLVALMYVMQRSLMYFPERLHTPPATELKVDCLKSQGELYFGITWSRILPSNRCDYVSTLAKNICVLFSAPQF